eukprot:m.18601 g.18601  ORF g.18601 m.18601 type:complete len:81 (+) comp9702_c0_seq1:763-1005(+)
MKQPLRRAAQPSELCRLRGWDECSPIPSLLRHRFLMIVPCQPGCCDFAAYVLPFTQVHTPWERAPHMGRSWLVEKGTSTV